MPERDGILGNLYFLDFMLQTGKTASQLVTHLFDTLGQAYYYDRIDVRFPAEKRPQTQSLIDNAVPTHVAGVPVTDIVTIDGRKFILGDKGWLLIRFSGTEPIMRVYCEVTDKALVQPVLQAGMMLAGL